ncbi:MAG TPA: hypothetical protein PKK80_04075 [Bacilli bacterium]|nr:hypothetical protein [Bacilli bacterium]
MLKRFTKNILLCLLAVIVLLILAIQGGIITIGIITGNVLMIIIPIILTIVEVAAYVTLEESEESEENKNDKQNK